MLYANLYILDFFGSQGPYDMRRRTHHKGIFREFLPVRHKRTRSDNAILFDMGSIHDNRPHANKDIVLNRTTMEYRTMPDSHFVTDMDAHTRRNMNANIILDISPFTNFNLGQVATQNSIIKHRRIITDANVANKARTICQKDSFAHLRGFTFIPN